MSSLSKGLLYN